MNTTVIVLLSALSLVALAFIWRWWAIERARRKGESKPITLFDTIVGFFTNFLDTLGIGSFATTTSFYKLRKHVADENIPGTLNVGHALPTVTQALVYIAIIQVGALTLVSMIVAAVAGAWFGAGVVTRLPRRAIQIGMGVALLVAATIFVAVNLEALPGGGTALELTDARLMIGVAVNFLLGALMTLGIGLYAPCLISVSLLGMNPQAAFPIMMGSCAFLMPTAGIKFIKPSRYDLRAALGLAIGGIPGVLIAAFIVKSLPIEYLRWLVVIVVLYAALAMLRSAMNEPRRELATP
ncbi:MAG TPA: sulfite exporter TauE/SafE family protein [Steroidobacteraceae bacterium]